jgi:type II secretory pathway pseudopilin PulG
MLMLAVTILAIAAAAIVPSITQQVKRDQEEELIHRGVQYSRAIRLYFKKFARYPSRIEELEKTNNLRFLRKRYKDPINHLQDFKLLHYGEVQMFPGGGLIGASPVGAQGAAGGAAQLFNAAAQGMAGAMAQGLAAQSSGMNAGNAANTPDASGQDSNPANSGSASSGSTTPLPATVFGGGPIVGVASKSKDKTIREFNKKNHYHDWQFIYDPNTDRGGLLNTPAQPPLQGAVQNLGGQAVRPGTAPGGNQNVPFGMAPQNQNSNQGPGLVQPQPPDQ